MLHNELTKGLPHTMSSTILGDLVELIVRDIELVARLRIGTHTFPGAGNVLY